MTSSHYCALTSHSNVQSRVWIEVIFMIQLIYIHFHIVIILFMSESRLVGWVHLTYRQEVIMIQALVKILLGRLIMFKIHIMVVQSRT